MNKIDKSISVVVPVYNSEATISILLDKLEKTLLCFKSYSITLVNDCSMDMSNRIIKSYAENNSNISLIDLKENVGQQKATFLGLKYAKGDYIVVVDDDLANEPDDILTLYDKIEEGYDVVYGIKKKAVSKSPLRNLGSQVRDYTFDCLTKKPKDLKVSSFRIIKKEINEKIILADTDYIYISMEILKHTINIENVYVDYTAGSPTNYSFKKLINIIWNMYIYYSNQKIFKLKPLSKDTYKIREIINGDEL